MSKLSEIVEYKKGFAFKSNDYSKQGYFVIRVSDFSENSIDFSNVYRIEENKIDVVRHTELKIDDVIIATVGSWANNPASVVGKVIRVPVFKGRAFLNQNTVRLRAKKESEQLYLYYLLKNKDFSEYIISTAQGSANQASITLNSILNYEFMDLDEFIKNRAVCCLDSLDKKIQLNTQINQTLEQIAQAIFKSWFIDFDPVKAKAEAKALGATDEQANIAAMSVISGKSPDQLNAYKQTNPTDYQQLYQLAQAFPSEFEEIDGVEVPKGWGRVSIADKKVLEIIKPRIDIFDGEKEYIATANVSGNSIVGDLELISYENRPSRANMQPVVDSIWFAKMVGEHKAILIDKNDSFLINRTILSTGFMGLKPKENRKCFLYCYINSEQFKQEKNQLATGAVQIALNNGSFSKIQITLPADNVLAFFENKLSDIFSKISENHKENKVLANARDLLLPKLLSGEL